MSVNFKYLTLFLAALAIYLLWMDVGFYLEVQKLSPVSYEDDYLANYNQNSSYIYSPFHPITVKLLMLPPFTQVSIFQLISLPDSSKRLRSAS